MGRNIIEDDRGTVFLDYDGSCIVENNDPNAIPDIFIPSALEWVKDRYIEGYRVVVTTSRRKEHCKNIGLMFGKHGIQLTGMIYGLGNGPRLLVNDHEFGKKSTAIALNPIKDAWICEM